MASRQGQPRRATTGATPPAAPARRPSFQRRPRLGLRRARPAKGWRRPQDRRRWRSAGPGRPVWRRPQDRRRWRSAGPGRPVWRWPLDRRRPVRRRSFRRHPHRRRPDAPHARPPVDPGGAVRRWPDRAPAGRPCRSPRNSAAAGRNRQAPFHVEPTGALPPVFWPGRHNGRAVHVDAAGDSVVGVYPNGAGRRGQMLHPGRCSSPGRPHLDDLMDRTRHAPLFHVNRRPANRTRQNSGRLAGTPTRRGNRSGHGATCRSTCTVPPSPVDRPNGTNPSAAKLSSGQRSMVTSGGSDTMRCPPTRSSGPAHSAVTPGGPKLRATTASASARNAGSRPTSSAREAMTRTRDLSPSRATASSRNEARRSPASTRHSSASVHMCARTSPGTPPPLPRSTT